MKYVSGWMRMEMLRLFQHQVGHIIIIMIVDWYFIFYMFYVVYVRSGLTALVEVMIRGVLRRRNGNLFRIVMVLLGRV